MRPLPRPAPFACARATCRPLPPPPPPLALLKPPPLHSTPLSPVHRLYLNSDAGSNLLVDGELVIDNEARHKERELSVTMFLQQGLHAGGQPPAAGAGSAGRGRGVGQAGELEGGCAVLGRAGQPAPCRARPAYPTCRRCPRLLFLPPQCASNISTMPTKTPSCSSAGAAPRRASRRRRPFHLPTSRCPTPTPPWSSPPVSAGARGARGRRMGASHGQAAGMGWARRSGLRAGPAGSIIVLSRPGLAGPALRHPGRNCLMPLLATTCRCRRVEPCCLQERLLRHQLCCQLRLTGFPQKDRKDCHSGEPRGRMHTGAAALHNG